MESFRKNCFRYIKIIEELSQLDIELIIYGNTSIYNQEQVRLAKKWNELLDSFLQSKGLTFVNVLNDITDEFDQVKKEYINDISHASQAVLPLVFQKLQSQNILSSDVELAYKKATHNELKNSFIYNERFGSFIMKKNM